MNEQKNLNNYMLFHVKIFRMQHGHQINRVCALCASILSVVHLLKFEIDMKLVYMI